MDGEELGEGVPWTRVHQTPTSQLPSGRCPRGRDLRSLRESGRYKHARLRQYSRMFLEDYSPRATYLKLPLFEPARLLQFIALRTQSRSQHPTGPAITPHMTRPGREILRSVTVIRWNRHQSSLRSAPAENRRFCGSESRRRPARATATCGLQAYEIRTCLVVAPRSGIAARCSRRLGRFR